MDIKNHFHFVYFVFLLFFYYKKSPSNILYAPPIKK